MRFALLGSGSSGNVSYLESGTTRLLVDAGLTKAELERRLQRLPGSVALAQIDAVLITHDHRDHAGSAAALGRPLYATAGTRQALSLNATRVLGGSPFRVGDLSVLPVTLPHDAVETVGYVLSDGQSRVGILTDCGHDAPEVAAAYAGCDLLVLETNHDATLLSHGPYPPSLKRRVGGRRGHLSNDQAASLLKQMLQAGPAPKVVIAAHLSQINNRPRLAKRALDLVLGRIHPHSVVVVANSGGAPLYRLEAGQVKAEPLRHDQLAFSFQPPQPAAVNHD